MNALLSRLRGGGDEDACECRPAFEGDRLVVDASDCPDGGRLASSADCRETVVEALTDRDAETVVTRADGTVRAYEDEAAALLTAAGRFADAAAFHDERLAARARRDPLAAAREATGRAGPVERVATETGLAEGAARAEGYDDVLRPFVGPTVSRSRVAARPPSDARLRDRQALDGGGLVRIYERPTDALATYHLEPVEARFDEATAATLSAAYDRLAGGEVGGAGLTDTEVADAERAPGRAARAVADEDDPVEDIAAVLHKHARGYGVVADLFTDPRVSDVFATAPVAARPLRVRVDGEAMRTNVRLTDEGAAALASRFRRESGRAFSGADPTLDAAVATGDRRVRVAAVTDPVSDGVAFAFRAGDRAAWTLPALVANGTMPADAAALLSVAVERGAASLVAGPRGAGKTTCLSALLWEIPVETRAVVIEDTPELPVDALQSGGRDVQALRSSLDDAGTSPTEALRTALRLGSGALVVGEIRGEEAGTLYEAMRVGANDGAVLGTIHGDGGAAVRERVVADLGVPESSFAATDVLVTLEAAEREDGTQRRVRAIEEVERTGGGRGDAGDERGSGGAETVEFVSLYERDGDGLGSTDRIERGNSRLVAALARPGESYADLRAELSARTEWLDGLATTGRTDPETVERARVERVEA
ncbi:type II/IV secretion system ATPase subunit [Halosimplex litoreum]|uniref:Type II/IV secretion system ATPase subunit n=1 Tax=Halosimplex litoreum TaxID=1198301 RepID=A0A7T3G040_9EURY|nr:ATPase, T2SS/T4P/T4SS family [Halosimplex litoreum]QPV63920.1 type II/IV secretion system ATPase subunit [Halosimplex litoreum]